MNVPRICTNPGCLSVLPPTKVQAAEGPDREEETAKLQVMDANRKCSKCGAKLTKYIHKVWDLVKDNEDITKQFRITDKEAVEKKQQVYKDAKKATEEQAKKDEEEGKKLRRAV